MNIQTESSQNYSFGSRYLLIIKVTEYNENEFELESDFQEFFSIWKNAMYENGPTSRSFTSNTETSLYQSCKLPSIICESQNCQNETNRYSYHFVSIPVTVAELAYLSSIVINKVIENDDCDLLLPPLYYDHTVSASRRISLSDLDNHISKYLDQEDVQEIVSGLNQLLFSMILSAQNINSLLDIKPHDIDHRFNLNQLNQIIYPVHDIWPKLISMMCDILNQMKPEIPNSLSPMYIESILFKIFPQYSQDTHMVKFNNLERELQSLVEIISNYKIELNESKKDTSNTYEKCLLQFFHIWSIINNDIDMNIIVQNMFVDFLQFTSFPENLLGLKKLSQASLLDYNQNPYMYLLRTSKFHFDPHVFGKIVKAELETEKDEILLFRGTTSLDDDDWIRIYKDTNIENPNRLITKNEPHSLSFGSSLFSGIFYDITAVVWYYWTKLECKYWIKVKKNSNIQKNFYIPNIPPVISMAAISEMYHPRNLVYIDPQNRYSHSKYISGIHNCSFWSLPEFLISSEQLPEYKTIEKSLLKWQNQEF